MAPGPSARTDAAVVAQGPAAGPAVVAPDPVVAPAVVAVLRLMAPAHPLEALEQVVKEIMALPV